MEIKGGVAYGKHMYFLKLIEIILVFEYNTN